MTDKPTTEQKQEPELKPAMAMTDEEFRRAVSRRAWRDTARNARKVPNSTTKG